jgi:hypothetical protein
MENENQMNEKGKESWNLVTKNGLEDYILLQKKY